MKKKTLEEFKIDVKKIHGDDVQVADDSVYINSSTKIKLICKKHGVYWQTPNKCLQGHHCPECAKELNSNSKFLTTEEFIAKSKQIHGDSLIYDKVNYTKIKPRKPIASAVG